MLVCLTYVMFAIITYTLAYVPESSSQEHLRPSRSGEESTTEHVHNPEAHYQLALKQIVDNLRFQEPSRIEVIYEPNKRAFSNENLFGTMKKSFRPRRQR